MKYLSRCSVGDFEALQLLCAEDPSFPDGEPAWDRLIAENDRLALDFGELPLPLQIDVDDFQHWCWTVAVRPGLDVLASYVIVLRHQRSDWLGGFDKVVGAPGMPPDRGRAA
jgi:hypothetical protein